MIRRSTYSKGFRGRLLRWFDRQVYLFADASIQRAMQDNPALAHITALSMRDIANEAGMPPSLIQSADELYRSLLDKKIADRQHKKPISPEACNPADEPQQRRPWGFGR